MGFRIDDLEPRTLLAVTAGPQFRVNGATYSTWADFASDAHGDFVVAWEDDGAGGSTQDVYARRYDAAGAPLGTQFQVNTTSAGFQGRPSVACDADGDFIVSWDTVDQDGSGLGVYARRFDATGAAQGGEFRVNTHTLDNQSDSAVAADAAGDFVITWMSGLSYDNYTGSDGSGYGIYARRYNAAGVAQGDDFRVNDTTAGNQLIPSVAMDAGGDFVLAWENDGSGSGVYAKRYDAAGVAQGGEFPFNDDTVVGDERHPSVAFDADGDFVVVVDSLNFPPDGSGFNVYARQFDAAGVARASEFRVNTFTTGDQIAPSVAADAAGDFVVNWQSDGQDGSGNGIFGRQFDANGTPEGDEFAVNTSVAGNQTNPSVAMDADGDFAVSWQSTVPGYGTYARQFQKAVAPAPVLVDQVFVNGPGLTGQASANGVAFRNLAGIDNTFGYPVPDGANQLKFIPWTGGVNQIALRFNEDVASNLQQGDLVVRGVNTPNYAITGFTYDAATKTGVWTLATPIIKDKVRLILDDALVPGLDGEWTNGADAYPSGDGTAGGDFDFRLNVLYGDANQDGKVNALDLGQLKAKLNRTATNPGTGTSGYSVFADLNADGSINALDLGFVKAHLNLTGPPDPEPLATSLLFSTKAISR